MEAIHTVTVQYMDGALHTGDLATKFRLQRDRDDPIYLSSCTSASSNYHATSQTAMMVVAREFRGGQ